MGSVALWRSVLAIALGCSLGASVVGCGGAGGDTTYGPSAGCDDPDPAFAREAEDAVLEVDGEERIYNLVLPKGARGEGSTTPRPLVIGMHGATGTNEGFDRTSELPQLAKEHGFVFVSPQARGASPIWDIDPDGPDAAFIDSLVDELESGMCIDTARIYLTGFSMGGMMSLLMACQQPDRFAAIAPVGGFVQIDGCDRDEPVPLIAFHGTDDESVGFDGTMYGGVATLVGYSNGPPVRELTTQWADDNGCDEPPAESRAGSDVVRIEYACPSDGSVELYVVEGGSHTWPGSELTRQYFPDKHTTLEIEAGQLIWQFFEAHPHPAS